MPRSFHANFAATWRKYCYVFPLQEIGAGRFDVEAEAVDSILRGLEGRKMHYNSFSYKVCTFEVSLSPHGPCQEHKALLSNPDADVCCIMRGRAFNFYMSNQTAGFFLPPLL